ncbi:MAG: hypothetical protein JXR64_02945 [Spirochaetales bacterium]|nr:hypothetical protein [Spirochaetales bacterium]
MGMNFGAMAGSRKVNDTKKFENASLIGGMIGDIGSGLINSSLSENNLKYGASKTNALEGQVGNAISMLNPAAGSIYNIANSGLNVLESVVGTGDKYDDYGYNHASGLQRQVSSFTKNLNPVSGIGRALGEGGEGSGFRALASTVPILGSVLQSNYEQKEALDRRTTANKIEESGYQLNKFNYMPNLDV